MTVFARLTCAVCTAERACLIFASAPMTIAAAVRLAVSADSQVRRGSSCFADSSRRARQRRRRRAARRAGARPRPRADQRRARLLERAVVVRLVERREDLALADELIEVRRNDSTMPDTWLPTWTVVTACSVPVAE
jgi:hypothetical protein